MRGAFATGRCPGGTRGGGWLGAGLTSAWAAACLACGDAGRGPAQDTDATLEGLEPLGAEPTPAPSAGADPAARDEAATLVIAVPRLPEDLDPLDGLEPLAARIVDDAVFEGLVASSATGWPWASPALADACVLHPNNAARDVYCHLAPDRSFHDGTPVTTEDVLYSLQFWLDPRRGWLRDRHGLSSLKRIEIVDGPGGAKSQPLPGFDAAASDHGRWVHIAFADAQPLALERIATMKIVPKAAHSGRRRGFSRKPVGSGPMQVAVFESERIVLEQRADRPAERGTVSRIVLRELSDGAQTLTLMRRGEVHIATELSPAHVPEELAKAGSAARFEAWLVSPPRYDLVLYNLRAGVQSGPRLRAALDAGIPRAAIAGIFGGAPPLSIEAPVDLHDPSPIDLEAIAVAGRAARWGTAGLVEAVDSRLDDDGAARLSAELDALGWTAERGVRRRDTGTLRLVLMWNGASGHGRDVAAALRAAWRGAGIVVPYATASWSYLRGPLRRGEFDLALARLGESSDADLYPYFHSAGALNMTGVTDAELDAALVAFRAAQDPTTRRAAKVAIAARLAAIRPVSVLRAPTAITLVSRRVEGLRFIDDLPALAPTMRLSPSERWTLSKR